MANMPKREMLILRRRQSLKPQIGVAAELGISQAMYSNIENGYRNPSDEDAKKLIKMFNLPDDYFEDCVSEKEE